MDLEFQVAHDGQDGFKLTFAQTVNQLKVSLVLN